MRHEWWSLWPSFGNGGWPPDAIGGEPLPFRRWEALPVTTERLGPARSPPSPTRTGGTTLGSNKGVGSLAPRGCSPAPWATPTGHPARHQLRHATLPSPLPPLSSPFVGTTQVRLGHSGWRGVCGVGGWARNVSRYGGLRGWSPRDARTPTPRDGAPSLSHAMAAVSPVIPSRLVAGGLREREATGFQ